MKNIELKKEQIYQGNLILVNAQYPLKAGEAKDLALVDAAFPEIPIRREAAEAVQQVLKAITAGDSIVPVSGYRSQAEQMKIYEDSLQENGTEFTRKYVALPGHSEHQTGLAIDLGLAKEEIDFIRPDFPYEGICEAFREIAPEYGLVERYAKEKEAITGIAWEPWHFRYVGIPHAELMRTNGLSLEEYTEFVKKYTREQPCHVQQKNGTEIELYYVPMNAEKTQIAIPENDTYEISGNNVDGFVVTLWRKKDAER